MSNRAVPFWSRSVALTTTPVAVALPDLWNDLKVSSDQLAYAGVGSAYAAPAVAAVNAIITLSQIGSPTSGTFSLLVWPGDPDVITISGIAYNASAATIKSAMIAAGKPFATGDITAAGGALPTDVTLTFTGVWSAMVPPIQVISAFDTGGMTARVTTVPAGNGGYGYVGGGTQEVWNKGNLTGRKARFAYLAAVSGTATALLSAYK